MNSLSLFSLLFTLLILNSCRTELKNSEPKFDLDKIKLKGKITVLMDNSTLSFYDDKGKESGFEYEILAAFAKSIGLKLEVKVINNQAEFFQRLNSGEGDIIACNRAVTLTDMQKIDFSIPYCTTHQVLIQRNIADSLLLKSSSQLGSKDVYIPKGSVFDARLKQLSDEIGENINRRYFANDPSSEDLIEMVSTGKIKFTVCNQNLALICAQKHANLSTNTVISAEQKIAFGIRKNNPKLKQKLNGFLKNYCSSSIFLALKDRYFNSAEPEPVNQILVTKNGNISPYDDLFKAAASTYGWDWKILASLCFQESNFNPTASGLGGAFGLMQFMPQTGPIFGVYPNSSPEVQIKGAMKLLNIIYNSWSSIPEIEQRIKFTLASYNAGKGHIDDGQRLALNHGLNHQIWDGNVQVMVKKLADPMYYRDPVVKYGAYRGPASGYATEVYQRYLSWK